MTPVDDQARIDSVRNHYNEIAESYPALMKGNSPVDTDRFIRQIVFFQMKHVVRGKVLEVCCGPGNFTRLIAENCPDAEIIGSDLSDGLIEVARRTNEHAHVRFEVQDAMNLSYADEEFDTVVLCLALHEMWDAEIRRVVREMRRVVKPGGAVVIIEHHVPENTLMRWWHHNVTLFPGERDTTQALNAYGLPRYLADEGLKLREYRVVYLATLQVAIADKTFRGDPFHYRDLTSIDMLHHIVLPGLRHSLFR